jgi:tetratricopeptide (TPR) repeat protein
LSHTYYQRALRINPERADAHNNLGDLFYVMKSYPAAEEEYKKALEINPDNAVYYNNLGLVYYGLQSFSGAVKMLTEAISLQPDFLEARNNLALVYMHLGLYPQALEELERALSSGPDNPEFYFNLAMVYLRGFNDSESAVFYLKKGLKLTSRNSPDDMIKAGLKNLERDIAIENLSYLSADCRGQL